MKKTIRRFVSGALCGLLLVSVVPVTFAAADNRPKWFYDETFNELPDGALPNAIQMTGVQYGENAIAVATLGDGNKALHMDVNDQNASVSGDTVHIKIPFESMGQAQPKGGKIVIQWNMKLDNQGTGDCFGRFVCYSSADQEIYGYAANYHEPINFNRHNGKGLYVGSGTVAGTAFPDNPSSTKFETIAFALDMDNHKADVYMNGVCVYPDLSVKETFFDLDSIRLSLYGITAACNTSMYVDDIFVYEADRALSNDEINDIDWDYAGKSRGSVATEKFLNIQMHDRVAFMPDSPYVYSGAKGREKILIWDQICQPYEEGTSLMVPAWSVINALGQVTALSSSSVSGTVNGKTVTFTTENGIIKDGALYVSAETAASLLGMQVYSIAGGVRVISKTPFTYTWQEDPQILRTLFADLIYDRPTGEEMVEKVKARYPVTDREDPDKDGHPRLVIDDAGFARIREEINTSTIKRNWLKTAENTAAYYKIYYVDAMVSGDADGDGTVESGEEIPKLDFHSKDGGLVNHLTGAMQGLVVYNAFLYQIYKDSNPEKAASYADLAWDMMEGLCQREGWGSKNDTSLSGLMGGRCMYGLAIGYDWLYDYLTSQQRQLILDNIEEKMMPVWIGSYDGTAESWPYTWWTFGAQGDNWNPIAARGAIYVSLAICDEPDSVLANKATHLLERAVYASERGFNSLMPDGAWYEGPSYWQSTTIAMVDNLAALELTTGETYGFLRVPGFHETGYYPVNMTGVYSHNFGNAGEKPLYESDMQALFYLANKYDDDFLRSVHYNGLVEARQANIQLWPTYRDFAFCVGDPVRQLSESETLDYHYQQVEVAGMRSSWDTDSALFASMETASGGNNSSANDAGSFVLDAYGQRFISDLGNDDYTLVGNKNLYAYRWRAEGHNTLVINPSKAIHYDQNPNQWAYIDRFESNDVNCYAITDLSDVYDLWNADVQRGIRMVDNRNAVLVQDEISLTEPGEIYWFAHTEAEIDLANDGKSAILTRGGVELKVEILSADGRFTVMDAKPLPTSPTSADGTTNAYKNLDNQLQGGYKTDQFKKLSIHLTDTQETTLAVLFTPMNNMADRVLPAIVPLDNWTLDDVEMVSKDLPTLSGIAVNEEPVSEFDAQIPLYEVTLGNADMPVITATNSAGTTDGVTISYPDSLPGTATVTITEGNMTNTYGVRLSLAENFGDETVVENPEDVLWYVVCLYRQDGTLMSVKHAEANPESGAVLSVTHNVPDPVEDYYLKAMLVTRKELQPIKLADEIGVAGT